MEPKRVLEYILCAAMIFAFGATAPAGQDPSGDQGDVGLRDAIRLLERRKEIEENRLRMERAYLDDAADIERQLNDPNITQAIRQQLESGRRGLAESRETGRRQYRDALRELDAERNREERKYLISRMDRGDVKQIPTAMAFTGYVLTAGLDFPWEMVWGPDDHLWVTERRGLRVTRVDPATGDKKKAADIPEAYPGPQHEGVLGLAFAPGFLDSPGANYVYVYYTIKDAFDHRSGKLVKFRYDPDKEILLDPQTVMEELPAGDDHNAGRLRFGPDGKLYLSIGEQGHNQGANSCLPIEAQRLPAPEELEDGNWDAYRGKVLRINPDGSIPADNPEIKGVRSHVFTYGHRNPQGLAFVGEALYECEHGPSSDDELNLLEPGGNYGWPHVAGFRDGMGYAYANYSAAPNCPDLQFDPNVIPDGVPVQQEFEWLDMDFKEPVKTFYTVRSDHNYTDSRCGDMPYLCWPTAAPSSIVYYPADGAIPQWRKSILMTTLKSGALFRIQMSGDEAQVQGDYDKHFRSVNRYRVVAIDPKGENIYIATDNSGGALDDLGRPAHAMANPGSILVFRYNPDGAYMYGGYRRFDAQDGAAKR